LEAFILYFIISFICTKNKEKINYNLDNNKTTKETIDKLLNYKKFITYNFV